MASSRAEWADLLKGIFIAMELIGTRMYEGGPEHAGWRAVRPNFSQIGPKLPRPADYNVVLRMFDLYPHARNEEAVKYLSSSVQSRMYFIALSRRHYIDAQFKYQCT